MEEYSREPCPFRIVEDCGGAFAMGLLGGGAFQGIKGYRNAPMGLKRRVQGCLTAMHARSAVIGGNFAAWGCIFSTIDCAMVHYRRKEDPWNSIISGALSGGILAMRGGMKSMLSSALVGGLLLTIIEGAGIAVARLSADSFRQVATVERNDHFKQQEQQKRANVYEEPTESNPMPA